MIGKYKLIYIAVVKEGSWIKHKHDFFHYIFCRGIKRHFPCDKGEEACVCYEVGGDNGNQNKA